jgi:hypothetical protein
MDEKMSTFDDWKMRFGLKSLKVAFGVLDTVECQPDPA